MKAADMAYCEGMEAYRKGKAKETNPYKGGQPWLAFFWYEGFNEAKKQDKERN